MTNEPSHPENFKKTLPELLAIGQEACTEIKRHRPDLVVILLHGGWAVYHAARAIWQNTEQEAFPPVLPINIGREKEHRYKDHRVELPFCRFGNFSGSYSDTGELGYYLNWVANQHDWLNWIKEQTVQLGFSEEQIQQILILDDAYFEGGTFYLAQQLLESCFPEAHIQYLAGYFFEWRFELSQPWLEEHQVTLPNDYMGPIGKALYRITTGSADLNPELLGWQPLHVHLPELQSLAEFLPLETWLELPNWICKQIEQGAKAWGKGEISRENRTRVRCGGFSPAELLFRYVWKNGAITSRDLAQITGQSLTQARRLLRRYYEFGLLTIRGSGKDRKYCLSPRYDLNAKPNKETLHTYWVIPSRLLSGDFLGWRAPEMIQQHLAGYYNQGLRLLIELDPEDSTNLAEVVQQMGMQYLPIDTPDNIFDETWIEQTLEVLSTALQTHPMVYLTSSKEIILGLILGCWLICQGMPGSTALKKMKRLRQHSDEPWLPFPNSLAARKFIRTCNYIKSP